jgi:diaminohydroxyphosphoribosylaminopyrimidine deaminase/5-amino-6-(5-phosphoribosylamino)uracil reductase
LVICAVDDLPKRLALEALGAEVLCLPDSSGRISLTLLMLELGRRQINELHGGGAILNGALIAAGCVDELLVYLAPKLLGQGAAMFALPVLTHVDQASQMVFHDVSKVGGDVRLLVRLPK